jgi:hypothetical protein
MNNIIFYQVHQEGLWTEWQDYLICNLKYAVKFCPDANIYLIGDRNPEVEGVHFYHYKDYKDEREERFKEIYEHNSPNPYEYEYNTIVSYFYINQFCKSMDIEQCIIPYTDVMILNDVTKIEIKGDVGCHLDTGLKRVFDMDTDMVCSHFMYINNTEILEKFVEKTMELFENKTFIHKIRDTFQKRNYVAGIADQVIWGKLAYDNKDRFCNIGDHQFRKPFFEYSISSAEEFDVDEKGFKKIFRITDKHEYYFSKDGYLHRINIIHWNGANKQYTKEFYDKMVKGYERN